MLAWSIEIWEAFTLGLYEQHKRVALGIPLGFALSLLDYEPYPAHMVSDSPKLHLISVHSGRFRRPRAAPRFLSSSRVQKNKTQKWKQIRLEIMISQSSKQFKNYNLITKVKFKLQMGMISIP